MAKVIIGCRLPNGLVLDHPQFKDQVVLSGRNKELIVGSGYGLTEVESDFWESWKKDNANYQPLKNGSLFESKNAGEAKAKGEELSKEKTGFEPMKKDAGGVKAADKE